MIMCKKDPNEPAWAYVFRQFCEKPHAVLCCLAMAAVAGMYVDFRAVVQGVAGDISGVKKELIELNIRLTSLEHKMNQG